MYLLLKKQMAKIVLFVFLTFGISACYSLNLIHKQHKLYSKREKVSKLVKSHRLDKKTKEKLILVNEALHFSEKEELFVGNSYKELIFNKEKKAVSFLLQVAYPFELKWHEWSYPVIGKVPYKGFFSEETRDLEARLWKEKRFDISESRVTAFSTLGWFADPLYSSMLHQRDFALVETIFHELVHKTYWIKDDVVSNEHLATYLSYRMTRSFFEERKELEELESYELYLADKKLFYHWLVDLKKALRTYYKSLSEKDSLEKKEKGKFAIFHDFVLLKKPKFKNYDFVGTEEDWNNARVLSSGLYQPDISSLDEAYACSKAETIGEFLGSFKSAPGKNFKAKKEYLCRVTE